MRPFVFPVHEIYDNGEALLRYRHQVCFNDIEDFEKYLTMGEYRNGVYSKHSWLTLGPLKLFKDGSLGARTALMKNGYVADREDHGLEWISEQDMFRKKELSPIAETAADLESAACLLCICYSLYAVIRVFANVGLPRAGSNLFCGCK